MSQAKIPERLYHYFEEAGRLQAFAPGETVYLQGDRASQLYFIREGRVRVFTVTEAGKEFTFEIIEKGRIFGESSFLSQSGRPVSAQAVTRVELLACGLDRLYAYLEESEELRGILFQLLSSTCNHLIEQLRRITLYDRYQKIASYLIDETEHPDRDRGVTSTSIPYTQDDLAMILGLNRVTVNRVLGEWKRRGAAAVSYGKIEILDRAYLKSLFQP